MTDLKQTATLMTPRRGFFTRVAGVMALGAAAFIPAAPRAEGEAEDGPNWPGIRRHTAATRFQDPPNDPGQSGRMGCCSAQRGAGLQGQGQAGLGQHRFDGAVAQRHAQFAELADLGILKSPTSCACPRPTVRRNWRSMIRARGTNTNWQGSPAATSPAIHS
jgi:hypothetical protein